MSEGDTRSPCGEGALPSSGTAGRLLSVDVTKTPTLSVERPRSVPSRISVVLVDGTMAGDTPGRECLREDGFWRPRLARRGRPVCVWVAAMQDCRVLGRRCTPLMLGGGGGPPVVPSRISVTLDDRSVHVTIKRGSP